MPTRPDLTPAVPPEATEEVCQTIFGAVLWGQQSPAGKDSFRHEVAAVLDGAVKAGWVPPGGCTNLCGKTDCHRYGCADG